jgi:uncharacterized membrane protein
VRQRHSAQVLVWVAVMLPLVFLPIIGLAMDAGAVFDARRGLQNVADGAARVGAMQLDVPAIRRGDPVQLTPGAAEAAARDYLSQVRPDALADALITAHTDTITVTLETTVQPKFLRLLKVKPVAVRATAQARPCTAVNTPTCQ